MYSCTRCQYFLRNDANDYIGDNRHVLFPPGAIHACEDPYHPLYLFAVTRVYPLFPASSSPTLESIPAGTAHDTMAAQDVGYPTCGGDVIGLLSGNVCCAIYCGICENQFCFVSPYSPVRVCCLYRPRVPCYSSEKWSWNYPTSKTEEEEEKEEDPHSSVCSLTRVCLGQGYTCSSHPPTSAGLTYAFLDLFPCSQEDCCPYIIESTGVPCSTTLEGPCVLDGASCRGS